MLIPKKMPWLGRSLAGMAMLMLAVGGLLPASNLNGQEEKVERPAIEELLPETTVVFVEIADVRELYEKLKESNMGKLLRDEAIAPLAADLYQQAVDAFDEFTAENEVELTMEQIQSLPGGEINIAVIAPKRKNPVFLFTFEFDQENENVDKVLNLARDAVIAEGGELESKEVEEVEFHTVVGDGNRVTYFQKDGVIVASNSEDELTAYLDRWMGREVEKIRPLSKNRKFITIMNRCRGTEDLPPDMRFYVDPIELARSAFRGNMGAQAGLNFLPILGLDGLLALGGSSIMFEGDFESVFHGHVLLANPRKGILDMIAFKPGSYQPPAWVPKDTVMYTSTSWDIKKMVAEIESLVDTFQGEGKFDEEVTSEVDEEMGEGFFEDVVNSLSGRMTFMQWINPESTAVNGEIPVFALELSEDNKFEEIRERIFAKMEEQIGDDELPVVEKEYKGVTYWATSDDVSRGRERRIRDALREDLESEGIEPENEIEFRAEQPTFAVLDGHLVIAFSPVFIEQAIDVQRGDAPSLLEDEDYKMTMRDISRLAGSDMPSVVMFQQPAESLRHYYKVVQGDSVRGLLSSFATENKYAANVERALDDNPLPPYENIEKYFQPTGSFVVNDDTGYHLLVFQIKAKTDEDE